MREGTILVTGADGFIGSHFIEHAILNTEADIVCVCSWSTGGMGSRLSDMPRILEQTDRRLHILTHDLRAPFDAVQMSTLRDLGVQHIVNFAADSHVDRSLSEPIRVVTNNVAVSLHALELARALDVETFVQISTDEVYGPAVGDYRHKEWDPIIPSNPYSASKAAQEAIAISYWRSFGVPVVLTNTMNNIGERQSSEKFFPMVIRSVLRGEVVPIHSVHGEGAIPVVGSRFYLHARNHADAVLSLLGCATHYDAPGRPGPHSDRPARFNVVGDEEMSNLDLALLVAKILRKELKYELVDAHSARPGHDLRYALCGKAMANTGWTAPVPLLASIAKTVNWYVANPRWLASAP